jgi:hypothetical protein
VLQREEKKSCQFIDGTVINSLPKSMMKQQQNEGEDYRHGTILMDVSVF